MNTQVTEHDLGPAVGILPNRPDPARYAGTAVNPRTFLATDYLNHFNEAIMLLELVAGMPECVDELADWAPKTYEEHFEDSVFKDRHLCIEAYAFVDPAVRGRLEDVVSHLDAGISEVLFDMAAANDDQDRIAAIASARTEELRTLIDRASGIINGVDHKEGVAEEAEESEHIDATQAAIDALFD